MKGQAMEYTWESLMMYIEYIITSHALNPVKPGKAFRKIDGQTPYSVHPIWCATALLHEQALPLELRWNGAQALFLHDILEDTTASLPELVSDEVTSMVMDMTYDNTDHEMVEVWSKPIEIKLLKLYDKVSNLLDASWMTPERFAQYASYTNTLADVVEEAYGRLAIVKMARAVTAL